jgi:two-component system response regulator MprA
MLLHLMDAAGILVVEDDPEMAEVLRLGLEQSGYPVTLASDGGSGLQLAEQHQFGAIVLDVLLPVLDGFQVATELRKRGNGTPILMLTAKAFVTDVVRGLDAGAQDYLAKPFSFLELSARLRALTRRIPHAAMCLRVGDLELDPVTRRVIGGTRELLLSRTQFRVLEVLMRAAGQVVRRRDIVDEVWGRGAWVEDNTLDVAIGSLRSALDKGHSRRLIRTVRGFGYRLEPS